MPPSRPRDGREFVRVSVTLSDDPKLLDTNDIPRCGWLYGVGLLYARKHKTDGVLRPDVVVHDARVSRRLVAELVRVGMWHEPGHSCLRCAQPPARHVIVHDYLRHNQSREEIEAVRDAGRAAAEARWSRAAERNANRNANRISDSHADRNAEVEEEEEKEQTPQPTPSVAPPTEPSRRDADPSRGTRLPADWQPTDQLIAWTKTECPDVGRRDVDQFRDYWHSTSGRTATKRDWDKAWKVWARREQTSRTGRRAAENGRSTTDQRVDQARALRDKFAALDAANGQPELATVTPLAIEGTPA